LKYPQAATVGGRKKVDAIHTPVLLRECLDYLGPDKGQEASQYFLIDSTLGEGGHSEAFLTRFSNLRIIGLDADLKIQARARERLARFGKRMVFCTVWFNDFFANFNGAGGSRPDAVLFDLGISLFHYELSGLGFSFRSDEPLDMRLDGKTPVCAADIVNGAGEKELAAIIYAYGGERYSRRIAASIARERRVEKIAVSSRLADIVWNAVPAPYRRGRIHPATKTFQALRIAVNRELERLAPALSGAFDALALGGKIGVITFHSLEDRIVKIFFKSLSRECICPQETPKCICGEPCAELLTKKAAIPLADEIMTNAPSRSAKLRVIRKTGEAGDARKTAARNLLEAALPVAA
jgi:16S rRNA (cytosine1402-N4)-methyltransferase